MGLKNQLLKVTFKIYQVGECVHELAPKARVTMKFIIQNSIHFWGRGLCPVACWILVPRLGIESGPLALKGWSLTTGPPRNSQMTQSELMA